MADLSTLDAPRGCVPRNSSPATALIICSRNRPELLADTVASVLSGGEVPGQLIIVDQSDRRHDELSETGTDRPCTVRYLWSRSIGSSRARNIGIAAAQGDILAFADDDMLADAGWFGGLIRTLIQAGPRSVVTGRVPPSGEAPGRFTPSTVTDATSVVYEGRVGRDVLFSNNMALYRTALAEVGTFDERLGPGTAFPAAEDNDLGFRLLEAGYRIVYVPEAVLWHRNWRTDREYLPLRWSYARGQGAYLAKHISLRDPYMLRRLVGSAKGHLMQFVRRLRHQRRLAYGDAVYTIGLLSGAGQWLLTQRSGESRRAS
jgi:GT2 family glycosyltransferase